MTAASTISNLKESAAVVSEFFYYGINNLLHNRSIYPDEKFTNKKQYGITIPVAENLNSFFEETLSEIREWLEKGQVQRMVLVINSVFTKEVLEMWTFDIHPDNAKTAASKDKMENEMRRLLKQINDNWVRFPPPKTKAYSWNMEVFRKKDREDLEAWSNPAPWIINNYATCSFDNFDLSTGVHTVKPAIAYKIGE